MSGKLARSQLERDLHVGKIMWVCNRALGKRFFRSRYIDAVERYMGANKNVGIEALLSNNDYSNIIRQMKGR